MRKSMEDVWKEIIHQDPNTTFSSILPQETPPLPPTQLPCQHGQEPHHHCHAFAFVAGPSSFCEKRMPEPSDDLDHRRRKRLIKSRESADRSRAKKQVHIHELELKLNHLMKENAKLRREQQKVEITHFLLLVFEPRRHGWLTNFIVGRSCADHLQLHFEKHSS